MAMSVFDVRIDDLTWHDFRRRIENWLDAKGCRVIVTPNAEMLLLARRNLAFRDLLNRSDLSIPDSVSLKFAAAVLARRRLVNRLPGVDALEAIAQACQQRHCRLLLLGGAGETAPRAAKAMCEKFPALEVTGLDPGRVPFDGHRVEIRPDLIDTIARHTPEVVAVALGQGKQEFAIDALKTRLTNVKIWIGVGGALDMIAGVRRRAPRWVRRIGCEWAWRLLIEPSRLPRTLRACVIFPLLVLVTAITKRQHI